VTADRLHVLGDLRVAVVGEAREQVLLYLKPEMTTHDAKE